MLQMDRIGVGSLTIVLLTGFFTGAVLAIQSEGALRRYGAVSLTGQLVALTLIRELGPVLSALMLSGRIGSGIASELGSMVVSEQINAMRSLGTDPTRRLVTPRMIAMVVMLPLLTIMCDTHGNAGRLDHCILQASHQLKSVLVRCHECDAVVGLWWEPCLSPCVWIYHSDDRMLHRVAHSWWD